MERGPKGAEATKVKKLGVRLIPIEEKRIWRRAIKREGGRILEVIREGQLYRTQESRYTEEGLVDKTLYRDVPDGHLAIIIVQPLNMKRVFERVERSLDRRKKLFGDRSVT